MPDAAGSEPLPQVGVVVALVAMQLAGSSTSRAATGADGRNVADQRDGSLAVVEAGGGDADRQGRPWRSTMRWILIPSCHGRSDSVPSAAPFEGPDADGVLRAPRPVKLAPGAEFVQNLGVELGPEPGLGPLGEPPEGGHPRTDRSPAGVDSRCSLTWPRNRSRPAPRGPLAGYALHLAGEPVPAAPPAGTASTTLPAPSARQAQQSSPQTAARSRQLKWRLVRKSSARTSCGSHGTAARV